MSTHYSASGIRRAAMLAIITALSIVVAACSDSKYDELTAPKTSLSLSGVDSVPPDSVPRDSIPHDSIPGDSLPETVPVFRLTARVFVPFTLNTTKGDSVGVKPVVGAKVSVYRLAFQQGRPIGPGTLVATATTGFGGRAVFIQNLPSGTYRVEAGFLGNGTIFETQTVIEPPTTDLVDLAMILQRRLLGR